MIDKSPLSRSRPKTPVLSNIDSRVSYRQDANPSLHASFCPTNTSSAKQMFSFGIGDRFPPSKATAEQ